jgi:hypothetical protein
MSTPEDHGRIGRSRVFCRRGRDGYVRLVRRPAPVTGVRLRSPASGYRLRLRIRLRSLCDCPIQGTESIRLPEPMTPLKGLQNSGGRADATRTPSVPRSPPCRAGRLGRATTQLHSRGTNRRQETGNRRPAIIDGSGSIASLSTDGGVGDCRLPVSCLLSPVAALGPDAAASDKRWHR